MGYGRSTSRLPRLYCYESALAYYNATKPWRGGAENIRPLESRRSRDRSISMDSAGVLRCRLYQTDCVVFHPNGDTTIDCGGWNTMTSREFISAISRFRIMPVVGSNTAVCAGGVWYKVPSGGITITSGNKVVSSTPDCGRFTARVYCRKRGAEIRKMFSHFIKWAATVEALSSDPLWGNGPGWHSGVRTLAERVASGDLHAYPDMVGRFRGKDKFLEFAYAEFGAVSEVLLPQGEIPKRTKWNR